MGWPKSSLKSSLTVFLHAPWSRRLLGLSFTGHSSNLIGDFWGCWETLIKDFFQWIGSFMPFLAQILGQKSPLCGQCNCVRQMWGHATSAALSWVEKIDLQFSEFRACLYIICRYLIMTSSFGTVNSYFSFLFWILGNDNVLLCKYLQGLVRSKLFFCKQLSLLSMYLK